MWNPMTHKTTLRERAFSVQGHLCFYCRHPMWRRGMEALAVEHGISPDHARMFFVTAEHLIARENRGRTNASNIVAACHYCNKGRHDAHNRHALFDGSAPDFETYATFVLLSVAAGLWHGPSSRERDSCRHLLAAPTQLMPPASAMPIDRKSVV